MGSVRARVLGLWLGFLGLGTALAAPVLPGGEVERRGLPPSTPSASRVGLQQAMMAVLKGDFPGADRHLVKAIAACVGRGQEVHRVGLILLRAQLLLGQDRAEDATEALKLGYQVASQELPKGHPVAGDVLAMVALTAELRGSYDKAETLYQRAAEAVLDQRGKTPIRAALFRFAQANNLETLGKFAEAAALVEEGLGLLAGDSNLDDQVERAGEASQEEVEGFDLKEEPRDRSRLASAAAVGLALKAALQVRLGQAEQARKTFEEAKDFGDRAEAFVSPLTIPTRVSLAMGARILGDLAEAESLWKRIVATLDGIPLITALQVAGVEAQLMEIYAARKRFDRIERMAKRVIGLLEGRARPKDLPLALARLALAQAHAAAGRKEEARGLGEKAKAGIEAVLPAGNKERERYLGIVAKLMD